jgi:hypothetical protein
MLEAIADARGDPEAGVSEEAAASARTAGAVVGASYVEVASAPPDEVADLVASAQLRIAPRIAAVSGLLPASVQQVLAAHTASLPKALTAAVSNECL